MNERLQPQDLTSGETIPSEAEFVKKRQELLATPGLLSDPSEQIDFSKIGGTDHFRFDNRQNEVLSSVAKEDPAAMERERALWELADRQKQEAAQNILWTAKNDPDQAVRWSSLWLLQKVLGDASYELLQTFVDDEAIEVADWSRLLLREISGEAQYPAIRRPIESDTKNIFDQTLPLTIAGYARTMVEGMGWTHVALSPLWFESIMGRVMACTQRKTFETDLTIEKEIKDFHADKTNHYEIYPFKGFSWRETDSITHHTYLSETNHTFYTSGKVGVVDDEHPALDDVVVGIQRTARTIALNYPEFPSRKIVQSVRGRYMGPAYVNTTRILENGFRIGPGEVQLSNLFHHTAGPLTNTYIYGSFKGKFSSWEANNENLSLNTVPCHSTLDGRLDYDLRGSPNRDPKDFFQN